MDVREMIARAQRLRRQLTEHQAKADAVQQELTQLNKELRQAMEDTGSTVSELSEDEFQMMLAEFNDPKHITVEVVYATREKQQIEEIQLCQGATIEDGLMVSGILKRNPEIDLSQLKVGIHGVVKPLTQSVQEGDRIEIYRPVESSTAT